VQQREGGGVEGDRAEKGRTSSWAFGSISEAKFRGESYRESKIRNLSSGTGGEVIDRKLKSGGIN